MKDIHIKTTYLQPHRLKQDVCFYTVCWKSQENTLTLLFENMFWLKTDYSHSAFQTGQTVCVFSLLRIYQVSIKRNTWLNEGLKFGCDEKPVYETVYSVRGQSSGAFHPLFFFTHRKHKGKSLVCDESVYSEDSGDQHKNTTRASHK